MQLTAVGALDEVCGGTHHLRFTNRHRPATSVYLANALLPSDRNIRVVAQRRDRLQHELDVEYTIAPRWSRANDGGGRPAAEPLHAPGVG